MGDWNDDLAQDNDKGDPAFAKSPVLTNLITTTLTLPHYTPSQPMRKRETPSQPGVLNFLFLGRNLPNHDKPRCIVLVIPADDHDVPVRQ